MPEGFGAASFVAMTTLTEIEAAVESLPVPQQEALFSFLAARLGRAEQRGLQQSSQGSGPSRHSVLDIPTARLGRVLRPLSPDDDLLGEMLEGRA